MSRDGHLLFPETRTFLWLGKAVMQPDGRRVAFFNRVRTQNYLDELLSILVWRALSVHCPSPARVLLDEDFAPLREGVPWKMLGGEHTNDVPLARLVWDYPPRTDWPANRATSGMQEFLLRAGDQAILLGQQETRACGEIVPLHYKVEGGVKLCADNIPRTKALWKFLACHVGVDLTLEAASVSTPVRVLIGGPDLSHVQHAADWPRDE